MGGSKTKAGSRSRQSPGLGIESNGAAGEVSREDVFEMLSNRRRRYVFHFLKHEDREVYVRELADRIAAWENGKDADAITAQERKRVKTALQQHHLPKMEDVGFVEYDSRRGAVALADPVSDLEVYLDVVPSLEVPWGLYYLGLAVVGLVGIAGIGLGVYPFSLVSGFAWSAFCTATLLVSASVHAYFSYARLRFGADDSPPGVTES